MGINRSLAMRGPEAALPTCFFQLSLCCALAGKAGGCAGLEADLVLGPSGLAVGHRDASQTRDLWRSNRIAR